MNPRVTVVAGGTKGIGFGIEQRLAERGSPLAVTFNADDRASVEAESKLKNIAASEARVLLPRRHGGGRGFVNTSSILSSLQALRSM